jgi:putative MATE family efflux protein
MSAPLVVSFISFSLMGTVDSLIMGRVGTAEQGAVGLGGLLAWGLPVLFTGTTSAVTTFVAQDYGARAYDRLRRHVYAAGVLIPLFVAIVWAIIPVLPQFIRLLGSSPEVAPHVQTYLSIRILGTPFLLTTFTLTSYLRGLGDMRTPMAITIIANIINAVLALILVFGWIGPPRGVAGAAAASVVAGGCEALLYVIVFWSPSHHRLYRTRDWVRPSRVDLLAILRLGLPIGASWLFDIAAWTLFSIYAATLIPAALAAHMIVFQIIHFSFLPAAAVSVVGTTLVGQYLGADRPDLAQRAGNSTILAGVGYMSAVGLTIGLVRGPLIAIFNADPQVVQIGATLLILAGLVQPFDGLWMTIGGVLRGGGDTRYPMYLMLAVGSLIFVPGVYLFGEYLGGGITGAWGAALVHVITVAILVYRRFRLGQWKRRLTV